jgi:hypothetical protein
MKRTSSLIAAPIALAAGSACLILLAGCVTDTSSRRGGHRPGGTVQVQATMVFEDDYDYYPGYEVYYSRNRHEYVYRDRNGWVRRAEPAGISLSALQAAPFVRVDFRDSPERHHDRVVRSYPRNWQHPSSSPRVVASVTYEDDYDYYPGYEVYYSRNRQEYVYREGPQWVRRREPGSVSLQVLLAAPSVRVDFRDSPERHHATVVRSYPKNWHRADNKRNDRRKDNQDRKNRKDDDKDDNRR